LEIDLLRRKLTGITSAFYNPNPVVENETNLQGSDVNLSTDRSVTNVTLNVENVIGVQNLNTTNIKESSVEIGKIVQMELNKALVDVTNIKLK